MEKISDNLYLIDTMMSGRPGYTSVFLVKGKKGAALLDAGVSVNAGRILEEIGNAGVDAKDLRFILLSHAHYDHAGGAHELIRRLRELGNSEVKVGCAEKPAVYLSRQDICDKLMRAGKQTEGAQAGEMKAMSREDLEALEPGRVIDLGGVEIHALDSPGHANGHLVFFVPGLQFLFAGDACGLFAGEGDDSAVIAPASFAPEYREELYLETLRKIAKMRLARLGFAHFGILENPGPALERAVQGAEFVGELAARLAREEISREEALLRMEERFAALVKLYGSRERLRLAFWAMLAGALHDRKREN